MSKKNVFRILFLLFLSTSLNLNVYSVETKENNNDHDRTTFTVKPSFVKIFRKRLIEELKKIISTSIKKNKEDVRLKENNNDHDKITFTAKPNFVRIFRERWIEELKKIISTSIRKNKEDAKLKGGEKFVTAFKYYIGNHHGYICAPGCTSIYDFKFTICKCILEHYLKYRAMELLELASSKSFSKDELELIKCEHEEIMEVFYNNEFNLIINDIDISSLNIPICIMCINDGRDYLNTDGKWCN